HDHFRKLPYLHQVAMEVRRMSPVVHVFFGKARRTFEFKGHTIPEGWMVLWGHRSSHLRPDTYTSPEKFDPDRFGPARAEDKRHEHAYVPNGAGAPSGHKCAGWELAPLILETFAIELLRNYRIELAQGQDLSYDWTQLPPEPRDGLRARVA